MTSASILVEPQVPDGRGPVSLAVLSLLTEQVPNNRLARVEVPLPKGASEIPGVIVPRKTVGEVRKLLDESDGSVDIELSDTRIRFASGGVTLVSKLIDGTFPDYERVIPTGNDKVLNVPCKEFANAVDRVSTISTEKSRAIKLDVANGVVTL